MSAKLEAMKALIAAWSKGDVDGALAHMHEGIVWHYAASVAPPLKGKIKARKFLENFKSQISEVRWRIFDYAENGDRLFVEGVDEYLSKDGGLVAAPYAGVIEFSGDLIIGWRDYVDMGVMESQKAGEPRKAWVDALIDRVAL
ncbi:nuclear transport factor 2 family protein [Phenylobacterium sp.]|uniref:nuclear transport factor 2 family protein n=1 Tax=Phenylobacterium sp. TaxID=1871053 RepID=UPI0030F3A186